MKTEQQNVSEEDLVAVTQRNTRAKTSINGGEPILVDLTFEICSRLPATSISRLRCVSKLWDSFPRLPYFMELFLTRSLARPRLLFACRKDRHMFFFSSRQPQNLENNKSSVLAATYHMKVPYHMKIPYHSSSSERCSSVRGLVLIRDERVSEGKERKVWMICNPSTGQYVTLPKLKTRKRNGVRGYLGYEPIEKQYKVFSVTWTIHGTENTEEHQVLTLGTGGEPSWRRVECCIPHFIFSPYYNHVCINGVLYYPAINRTTRCSIIILFDFRSEKFRVVEVTDRPTISDFCSLLINYNGKLGLLRFQSYDGGIYGSCNTSIRLRVLEDAEKHKWSEHRYVLPIFWEGEDTVVRVVGATRRNEIVFSCSQSTGVYVFYYNTERNEIRRVEIQGLESFKGHTIYTFLDHVEDVNVRHM
ncbi:F-box protein DOR-like [Capsella rubella]|uniref:F-box protein DOR-like n=1 Tax=Capsella rubella TaxID=81985 RepID=UPI000CD4A0E6|nr:F-box protein DOR-like [Capsella rubella]